jgi:peptide/nickel transport system ATP-binding protein
MSETLLLLNNLSVSFKTENGLNSAVTNLSLSIPAGKTVGLVGESGSGKSVTSLTILRLLSPTLSHVEGEVLFEGTDLLKLSEKQLQEIRGRKISMIFQEPMTSLNPVFTVGAQVSEVLRLHEKLSPEQAKKRVIDLFNEVGISHAEQRIHAYPHELSGGQKQRVMIAMAIACKPSLLIADEPTTALDVTIQKQILELLADLQKKYNMGLLFITHDLAVIADIADEVAVMYKGNLVESGPTRDVFRNPKHPYTKSLLNCRPSPALPTRRLATVGDFMSAEGKEKSFDVQSLGKKIEAPVTSKNSPLLEVKNLSTYFPIKGGFLKKTVGHIKAVDNVSLKILKGRTLGLVGESGSGKTTLGRTLLRLIEPTSGQIFFRDRDITHLTEKEMRPLRKEIQVVFQDPYASLNPRMRVGRAITEAMFVHEIGDTDKSRWAMAETLLKRVGLEPHLLHRFPHEFSGGQRQRLCIARALAVNPSFIICDESVSALDVSVQAQILNLLLDLKEEFDLTYIFISHDLAAVRFFSDEVAVMQDGHIVEYGPSDDIYNHPQQDYTKKLLHSIISL